MSQPPIRQHDLRVRSHEEREEAVTGMRDGQEIGALAPLQRRPRFARRAGFAAMSRNASTIELGAFRADQDAELDPDLDDPFVR